MGRARFWALAAVALTGWGVAWVAIYKLLTE